MSCEDRLRIRNNALLDSDLSSLFPSRQANRDGQRFKRKSRRRNISQERRVGSSSMTTWARQLYVALIISAISKTPFCGAFVTPICKNEISELLTISKTEFKKKKKAISQISGGIKRTSGTTAGLSSITPTNSNSMADGTNNNNNANNNRNNNNTEIAGLILAVAIILSLAGISGPGSGIGTSEEVTSTSVAVMTKVVENTVPTSSTEVVAVTLGESIGGVIGAIFSVAINFILKGGKTSDESSESSDSETSENEKSTTKPSLWYQGISDGDYFIVNSASNSLLEAAGVPESVAKYSSVFIAAIPSQLFKITSRILQQKRAKEEMPSSSLLRDEQERKPNSKSTLRKKNDNEEAFDLNETVPVAINAATAEVIASSAATTVATESTVAVAVTAVDFVEVFADVTRWLEYDVLKTEYGETALSELWRVENNLEAINPLQAAITFGLLGSLAAVSSRWYADVLYGRFCYGPIEKQREVRFRKNAEWFSMYLSTAASASVLFGCYEFFQLPVGRYIQGTLSGGVEGCVGSSRFDACLQTFIDTNSPGPTAAAQLRALITNLYGVYVRLQDIAGDTSSQDMSALIRAWSVSIASFIANL